MTPCSVTDSSSKVYRSLTLEEAWDLYCLGAPVERQYHPDSPYDADLWRPLSVTYGVVDSFDNFKDCYGLEFGAEFRVEVE